MSLSGETITAKPVAVTDRDFCLLQNSLLAVAVVVTDTVVATHEKERERANKNLETEMNNVTKNI